MLKYHNIKSVCRHGHKHDSKREANRCDELNLLRKGGVIKDLKQQPKFVLQPSFKYQGKTIRAITYTADFSYRDCERKCFVVEDCKGFKTKTYQQKKKMLLYIMRDRKDFNFMES